MPTHFSWTAPLAQIEAKDWPFALRSARSTRTSTFIQSSFGGNERRISTLKDIDPIPCQLRFVPCSGVARGARVFLAWALIAAPCARVRWEANF